jgi:membrane glycosyltransferase
MVVLHDRALLGLLASLPEGPAHAGAEAPAR